MDPEYCCKELIASSISVLSAVNESVSILQSKERFNNTPLPLYDEEREIPKNVIKVLEGQLESASKFQVDLGALKLQARARDKWGKHYLSTPHARG